MKSWNQHYNEIAKALLVNHKEIKEVVNIANSNNLEFIASASDRIVFKDGIDVVKFAKTSKKIRNNENEAKTWQEFPKEYRKYLVQVKNYGGVTANDEDYQYVVMPHRDVGDLKDEEAIEFREHLESQDIHAADITPDNIAIVDGQRKLVDYGAGVSCKYKGEWIHPGEA